MMKRWLGIDGVDFTIQALTTCFIAFMVSGAPGPGQDMRIGAVFAGSFLVLAFRRHWARKKGELASPQSGEYVMDLEQRVADLEAAQQRIYELEERVDFAERLLAQQRSPDQIGEPR